MLRAFQTQLLVATALLASAGEALAAWPVSGADATSATARLVSLRYTGVSGEAGPDVRTTGVLLATGTDRSQIVTSFHGLRTEPAALLVYPEKDTRLTGRLVGRDFTLGLALIEVAPTAGELNQRDRLTRPQNEIAWAEAPKPGQTAVAFGRALGSPNVSVGVISGVRSGGVFVQTDAMISPLNYGGLLTNLEGEAYGLIVVRGFGPLSGSDLYDSGIGFAVDWRRVKQRALKLAQQQDLYPGGLGAELGAVEPLTQPAEVRAIIDDGAAALAGLREGDLVTHLDGHACMAFQLERRLAVRDAGDTVAITYSRDGKTAAVSVVLQRIDHQRSKTPAGR